MSARSILAASCAVLALCAACSSHAAASAPVPSSAKSVAAPMTLPEPAGSTTVFAATTRQGRWSQSVATAPAAAYALNLSCSGSGNGNLTITLTSRADSRVLLQSNRPCLRTIQTLNFQLASADVAKGLSLSIAPTTDALWSVNVAAQSATTATP